MQKETISERLLKRRDKFLPLIHVAYELEANDLRAVSIFESECYYFERAIQCKPELADTTIESQEGVFLTIIGKGMSFNPDAKHVYLIFRNGKHVSISGDGTRIESAVKNLGYYRTADGKTFECIKAGSIHHVGHPVIVYEGDVFQPSNIDGRDTLQYVDNTNGRSDLKIIAGFVWIHFKDNRPPELYKMWLRDLLRLQQYAKDNSNGKGNALYTSNGGQVDTGFFKGKLITHALNPYNKSKIPSAYEGSEEDEEGTEETGEVNDYKPVPAAELREDVGLSPLPLAADKPTSWTSPSGKTYEAYVPAAPAANPQDDPFSV